MIITTSEVNNIYTVAVISRLGFLLLSVVSNFLISDHSSDSFSAPELALEQFGIFDKVIWILLGGLLRWDAQHFLHIASSGYTYENNLAFFPLFPVITQNLAYFLRLCFKLNLTTSLLFSSFFLNTVFFIKASSVLYTLTLTIFKNKIFAYYSVLFFSISPATIFFLAPYSESLFTFCVFKGMLKYAQQKYWYSLMWFSASAFARANGLVNIGFILHLFYYYILLSKCKHFKTLVKYVCYSFLSASSILLPFVSFQIYSYLHFCVIKTDHSPVLNEYAKRKNLLLAGFGSSWCNDTIPFSYSYVQQHYWNVGFLKYYSLKQIPNFCLAFPIVFLIFTFCGRYLYHNWRLFFYVKPIYKYDEYPQDKMSPVLFVYVVHVIYLTFVAVSSINVQVTTRLIASSSPLLYWIAAQEFIKEMKPRDTNLALLSFPKWIFLFNNCNKKSRYIKWYFLSYAVLGTILFSNNFPWT